MMKTMLLRSMMNNNRFSILLTSLAFLLITSLPARAARSAISDEAEVRAVVQTIFEHLKSEQYDELYDTLPAASRSRITRERFTNALRRQRQWLRQGLRGPVVVDHAQPVARCEPHVSGAALAPCSAPELSDW